MKRWMALTLCLLCALCLTASAQSVPEQVQAPEHVTGTYTSPSGRTTVSLDAQVVVPQVAAMPIYEVHQRTFSAEEACALADLTIGPGAWEAAPYDAADRQASRGSAPAAHPSYLQVGDNKLGRHYSLLLQSKNRNQAGYPLSQVIGSYLKMHGPTEVYYFNSISYTFKQGEHHGANIGSPEDARKQADRVINQLFPFMTFHSVDPEKSNLPYRIFNSEELGEYGHQLYYARKIGEAWVTPVYQEGSREAMGDFSHAIPYEKLYMDVGQEGIFAIRYENPLTLGNMLQEQAALLPFEHVMDVFARVAPLKYAATELEEEQFIQVDWVVLGYMQLQMKDNPTHYQLVPVWDFMEASGFGEPALQINNYVVFTVNAMDGTVIDRDLGY